MKRLIKNTKGFSLVESLLSMAVLSIMMMGGTMAMRNSLLDTVNKDMGSIALQLANEKVEAIQADNQFVGYEYVSEANEGYADEELSGDFAAYTRSITITEVDAGDLVTPQEGSGIKKVDVSVSWGTKSSQQVKVTTLVADLGEISDDEVAVQ